jgi:hypothetical protein
MLAIGGGVGRGRSGRHDGDCDFSRAGRISLFGGFTTLKMTQLLRRKDQPNDGIFVALLR